MSDQAAIELRKKIKALQVGESTTIPVPVGQAQAIPRAILKFARGWTLPVQLNEAPGSVTVTRVAEWPRVVRYPELDNLAVGGSHLYELPPALHQRVRQAASFISRSGSIRLSCSREGEFIRVTRLPATDDEAKNCPPIKTPERSTRWALERLATEPRLSFDIDRAEHHKLRLAVTFKAKQTGWTIRCRLQDDGTMLVYRTDVPPAATDGDSAQTPHHA